jgi:hypothetical protein
MSLISAGSISLDSTFKPLAKRPGGLTYVRPRYRGWRESGTDDVAYPLFRPGSAGTPLPPGRGGGGREHGCSRPQPPFLRRSSLSHPPTLGSRDSASPWGGLSRQSLVQDRRDATDFLPTSLFPSSLTATLHPAASENGRLGYSMDASGFVPNPCSLSSPSVKPL